MKHNDKIILICLLLALMGCEQNKQQKRTVGVQSYQTHSQFKGKVEAYAQTPHISPISGLVTKVYHQPGEFVEKDTLIFKIKSEQAQQILLTQLSKKHHTESKYQQIKRQEKVYQELLDDGAISQNEFSEISNRRYAYEFDMVEIRHQLERICPLLEHDLCHLSLDDIEKHLPLTIHIRSNVNGIIHKSQKDNPFGIGQQIKQNEPLFSVANTDRIVVEFPIDDHESDLFAPGSAVFIHLQRPHDVLNGMVENVQPSSDKNHPEQFIVRVRSEPVAQPKSIRIGAMAEVKLPSQNHYLLIPHAAIFSDQPQSHFVEKATGPQDTQKIPIKIIQSMGWYAIIKGTLEPNDQLVLYDPS